jgi:hypothetical protein
MKPMRGLALITLLVCCVLLARAANNNKTISDVYVNLPATCSDCHKVHYELTAYGGCYLWTTSNPQLVALEQIPDSTGCVSRARITEVVSRQIQTVVIIRATEVTTKEVLISQVQVSRIAQIKILTNFMTIDVNDVQKLYIEAFDESGNVLSSVEGLQFDWRIESNAQALKVITSKEANYENTPVRLAMERNRLKTDLVLVRGIQTGIVEVSATFSEREYYGVPKAYISLLVIEPFFLIPEEPVHLLPRSEFIYKISRGKRQIKGRTEVIASMAKLVRLPDEQYTFSSRDDGMLDAYDDGKVVTRDKLGQVLVRVVDTHLRNNTVEGLVYVVEPDLLELSIRDVTALAGSLHSWDDLAIELSGCGNPREEGEGVDSWHLITDHVYAIRSCVNDPARQSIVLTSNIRFDLRLDSEYLLELASDHQHSLVLVRAVRPTANTTELLSRLSVHEQAKYALTAKRDLRIVSQVTIRHPTAEVLLPYLKGCGPKLKTRGCPKGQMWRLQALGGSGFYSWESDDASIAAVTSEGVVYGLQVGIAHAIVFDTLNRLNNASILVEVSPVGRVMWLEEKLELALNTHDMLSAIALDVKNRKYTNCTSLPLEWTMKDEAVARLRSHSQRNLYELLHLYVHGDGKSIIQLRHHYDHLGSTRRPKRDEPILKEPEFDEKLELHNLFGICGQREITAVHEGVARVTAKFRLKHDDGMAYTIDSEQAQVLAFKQLKTIQPSYVEFLWDLQAHEKDEGPRRYLAELKSESEFVLAFGSGLRWEVEGGTSPWIDIPSGHSDEATVERIGEGETRLLVHAVNGGAVKYVKPVHFVQCPYALPEGDSDESHKHGYKLRLVIANSPAPSLLRPASSELTIEVWCQLPQTMLLVWAQPHLTREHPVYEILPKKESDPDTKPDTYYVRNDATLRLRTLLFDKYRRLFYNFSSYERTISSTNTDLGRITALEQYYLHSLTITSLTGSFFVREQLVSLKDPVTESTLLKLYLLSKLV